MKKMQFVTSSYLLKLLV